MINNPDRWQCNQNTNVLLRNNFSTGEAINEKLEVYVFMSDG